jgi:hypothetical protein
LKANIKGFAEKLAELVMEKHKQKVEAAGKVLKPKDK